MTTLVFVAGFALAGALPDALDGFIRIHLTDTYQPGLQRRPGGDLGGAPGGVRASRLYLLVAGLAALPLVSAPALLRLARRRTTPEGRARDVALVAATAGELAGLAWS